MSDKYKNNFIYIFVVIKKWIVDILNGLENDLFPANFDNNNRESWGVGVNISPNMPLTAAMFNFDQGVQSSLIRALDHVKRENFNPAVESEPQFILNYVNGNYILILECNDGTTLDTTYSYILSRVNAINFINAIGANNFHDMVGTRPAVYDRRI